MKNIKKILAVFVIINVSMLLTGITSYAQDDNDRSDLRHKPHKPHIDISGELQAKIDQLRTDRQALKAELREKLEVLDDPTREEVKAVRDAFKEENSERIDATKALRKEIKTEINNLRQDQGDNTEGIERPPLSDAAKDLREKFKEKRKILKDLRDKLREDRETLTEEEIAIRKAELKAQFEDLKNTRKQQALDNRFNGRPGAEADGTE